MSQSVQEGWSLSRDGILWKKVVGNGSQTARDQAASFVEQLEASVGPVDFLCGLLLDRIAANCLRQQVLFQAQRTIAPDLTITATMNRSADFLKKDVSSSWFVSLLKYESFLNQVFHRDLILLQTLQKAHSVAPPVSSKKPPQSDRSLIEGQANSDPARQAIGALKKIELSSVANADRVEQNAEGQKKEVQVEDDPHRPGYVDLG
jgi:hypothetical protein